ncbi:MAG: fused MFS/spermidine synthase, partial [Myxococcota bacterium]
GNALLCIAAFSLDRGLAPMKTTTTDRAQPIASLGVLAIVALLAGLSSLICEVSWFRLMVLILGGSAYAFSIMLLSFLMGIGLGGLVGGPLADRAWAHGQRRGVLRALAGAQIGVAVLTYAAMYLFGELPFWFVSLYSAIEPHLAWIWPIKLMIAMGIMVPPALLMGATFPLLVRAAVDHTDEPTDDLGSPVGRLYGWNTVGSIFGAAVGGLVLLPTLHVTGTLLVAVSLNLLGALLLLLRATPQASPQTRAGMVAAWAGLAALLFVRPPPWNPLLMTAGMYKYVSDLEPDERSRSDILEFAVEPYELLFYEEGLSSVVTVAQARKSGNIWLANNGKVEASTSVDMPTQVLVAHLPFAFRPEPEDVLVIGLASGITAGAVTLHSPPKDIDIIELEPAIIRAAERFNDYNQRPLEDPRVDLIVNDGRNHLMLSDTDRYDLVVSEPSNPWLTGVSNLFTREFLEMGRSRLKPGGVWAQWVQMYGMDTDDLRSLMATFTSVYPHVLLFSTIEDADLVLLGSDQPLQLSASQMQRMFTIDERVNADLNAIDVLGAEDLLARLQLTRDGLVGFSDGEPLNTDDNMRIEYSAPLHLHEQTAEANFYALLERDRGNKKPPLIPWDAAQGVTGRATLAAAYARREDWLRATLTLQQDAEDPNTPLDIVEQYMDYQIALRDQFADTE